MTWYGWLCSIGIGILVAGFVLSAYFRLKERRAAGELGEDHQ